MTRLLSALLLVCSPLLASAQGLTPEQSLKAMKLPGGFSVQCVAHEPMVRQPVSISFDEKGRLWVLQYLQYPNYEGLKAVKQDQYLRTIWDKMPEPPPKGPKGLDRITILSDVGEDGKYRKSKDFVTGLNIASGFCIGNGGVYVAQPPYLLFYADKNKDDVPDGDPEVLLTGFGMNDTHSLANSLQWGPDGWLYGAAGSTSTSSIPNPANPKEIVEFQQGVWRYHPATKRFEMFSEGGGNTYGLDFDRFGRCITGTNFGGKAMLHQMQGAYYVKGFSKHGPLHNPHAYGYFDHVPYEGFKGGHVTCGGIVYDAELFPKEYRHQYIAANLLSNAIYMHTMTEKGSSFTAKHGADLLVSSDPWFRPVDCLLGPDGCVYVADFYDKRAAHLDPIDNWDKTNGRIYRISYTGAKPIPAMDLGKKNARELVELLKEPNKWWRNEARRLLEKQWGGLVEKPLVDLIAITSRTEAVEALWTLHNVGRFSNQDLSTMKRLLEHPEEQVRGWTVRFLAEMVPDHRLAQLVGQHLETEKSVAVRIEFANLAKQWPLVPYGFKLFEPLFSRVEDLNDPYLPLIYWWALESQTNALDFKRDYGDASFYRSPLFRNFILERFVRRIAQSEKAFAGIAEITRNAHKKDEWNAIFRGMDAAIDDGRTPVQLEQVLPALQLRQVLVESDLYLRVTAKLKDEHSISTLRDRTTDESLTESVRIRSIELLGKLQDEPSFPSFLKLFRESKSQPIQVAALTALQFDHREATLKELVADYPTVQKTLQSQLRQIILSRPASAKLLLDLIDSNKLPKTELTPDQLRPLIEFKDEALTKLIEKHYGKIAAATPGEKQARITWLDIQMGKAQPDLVKGKELYAKHCSVCHQLFGEGGKVGPDLTTADRKNRRQLLTHVVDPSLYIRPEYVSFNVNTFDGRRLSGLVSEQGESITLTNVVNNVEQKSTLAKKEIEEMKPSAVSLMPEKLFDTISEDDVRNLLGYLQQEPKKEAEPKQPVQPKKETAKKLKVLLISGSLEYESDKSLANLQATLEANHPIECLRAFRKADNDIPGLDQLETCDVAIFFTRRLTIEGEQLERVKKYLSTGKPVIGIRTASHGFQKYLEMDKEIFGGDYKGHHGNKLECKVTLADGVADHPILKGVKEFKTLGSLYKNADIAKDCKVLLTGSIDKFSYPVAWTREVKGQRIFYTSLGYQDDFKDENFVKLLSNAIAWCTAK